MILVTGRNLLSQLKLPGPQFEVLVLQAENDEPANPADLRDLSRDFRIPCHFNMSSISSQTRQNLLILHTSDLID